MDNMAAMTSAEARKLDLGLVVEKDSMKGVDETGVVHHEVDTHGLLIGQQYILDRPDSEGGPQVVKLNAQGQLVPCDMIPHPLGQLDQEHQGLVVHMVPPGSIKEAFNMQHMPRALMADERYMEALPAQGHYEHELMGEISEEDRRLAQTLMSVQYGQKHKMLEPMVTNPGESNVIMSVADTMIIDDHLPKDQMVVEYIQQVASTDGSHYEPKVVRILQQHEQELVELAPARVDEEALKQHHQNHLILRRTLTGGNDMRRMEEQHVEEHVNQIKNEDEEGLEIESEEDHNDSDYEAAKESRSSRRSLPHKKRIPKKLKGVKSMRCGKCGECFSSQAELTAHRATHNKKAQPAANFSCQLCNKGFPSQIKFFEHLKAHYEPQTSPKPEMEDDNETLDNEPHIEEENHEEMVEEEPKAEPPTVIVQELPPALPPPLSCTHCNKVFRRQRAFEAHLSSAHGHLQIQVQEEQSANSHDMVMTEATAVYMSESLMPVAVSDTELDKKEWPQSTELTTMSAMPPEQELRENTVIVPPPPHAQPSPEEHMMMHPPESEEVIDSSSFHLCDHCGTGFALKAQLLAHIRDTHSDQKRRVRTKKEENAGVVAGGQMTASAAAASKKSEQLTCPHCGRVFNHRNSLVYHLRSHTGERPHQCEVCGKSFFAASALKVHMRLHSGDKPYKCELCGRHFRQWGDLKYHCISIHTEEKQYQCEYCGKDFARKYSLIVHRRIHTGEKNYKCEFCGKTFRASSYLQNHRRIHTGEKPHPCEICGKPFRVRSDMKRHMNTHNRERGDASAGNTTVVTSVSATSDVEVGVAELAAEEVSMPDETVVIAEESLSQPMNLNLTPGEQGDGSDMTAGAEQTISAEEVHENGLQYARDPLETVRAENGNTLYVWPIYMG